MKKALFIKRSGRGDFSATVTACDLPSIKSVESKWAAYSNGRFIPIAHLGKPIIVNKLRPLSIPLPRTSVEIAAAKTANPLLHLASPLHLALDPEDEMPPFGL